MILDRRQFALMAGAGVAEAARSQTPTPAPGQAASAAMQNTHALSFPKGFRWGVATAAYQIEGAANADGKGPSIWDVYAHTPGKMANGDTGDVAIDHYHRYREDIQTIRGLGANAYRFSISWPRIFPNGTGKVNEAGMDFYSRLVDAQLEAGIEPFVTLYHWDLPQALQDKGGWQSRDTARAFADYAAAVAVRLGDRVKHFFTLNELQNFVDMGHQGTSIVVQGREQRIELAPGLKLSTRDLNQVAHHAVLAHGLSVQAMRAAGPGNLQIGPADVLFAAVPVSDTPANVRAAERATRTYNDRFLDVMLTGRYDDAYLAKAGPDAPRFTDEDMRAIGSPLDFVGVNIYVPKNYVEAADNASGFREIPTSLSHPRMGSRWHSFSPEVMYWGPRLVNAIWRPKAIYVTENGCAADDAMTPEGRVLDTDRLMYLRAVMTNLHRAIAEGAPIRGNFAWSAFDNLEWTGGYGVRFGLVHVDFATQKRTPKLSADWYRRAAEMNGVA